MGEASMMSCCEGDQGLEEVEVVMVVDVGDGRLVRREKLPPRMALRILLVEADDSTRQVIGALLRKCGYKVSAVSDGLKALEVLKRKPNSVDLILTEVDLPLITGSALLTLIMEHDSCKNIPVIMMSTNDSVNMVYKYMLRGAADFLVKPVRKNELQNLWQHVWRRQSLKAERLSNNDLPISLSNGACMPEKEEYNEKGNDAQSSCSVQEVEAVSAYNEKMPANPNLKGVCDTGSNKKECFGGDSAALKPTFFVIGSSIESPEDAIMMIQQEDSGWKKVVEDCYTTAEASDNNDDFINGSREAIDLIGNFQNHSMKSCVNSSVTTSSTKFDPCPQLDLSLRRRCDNSESHQDTAVDERSQAVHQSSASAFSRYIALQPSQNTQANTFQPREYEASSDKHISSPILPSNSDMSPSHQNTQKSLGRQAATELRQRDISFYCNKGRMLPVTVPVKSVRLDQTCPSNGSSLHPSCYKQADATPTPCSDSTGTREVLSQVTQVSDPNASSCGNQTLVRQETNPNASSSDDRSQNSNLFNEPLSRMNSTGGGGSACGSNGSKGSGNGNLNAESKANGISTQEENIHRSLQREAALTKFRQKRKDRCFDKKVRYESRKKLAEQRPRVKGQFVREAPADPSTALLKTLNEQFPLTPVGS